MITFLKTWSNQIIVASIIAVILEMLLPEGNNKKYIKMIIGIYVLFTIISPVISKITGNNLEFEDFEYRKYFDSSIITSSSAEEFEANNSKLIKQAYIDNIKNDIKTKIKQKGYDVDNIKVNIISDEDSDKYGTITNIDLQLRKKEEIKEQNQAIINNIEINEIQISNSNNNTKENKRLEETKISDKEKLSIKEYLSNEYSIDKDFIVIN